MSHISADGLKRKKRRRILINLLALQVAMLFLLFPVLLVYIENDRLRQQFNLAGQTEFGVEREYYTYIDGLYWTLITPISLKSNDRWPASCQGWLLVRLSDATKLLTVGVTAGLMHDTVTTRQIQRFSHAFSNRSRRPDDEVSSAPDIHRQQFSTPALTTLAAHSRERPFFLAQRFARGNGAVEKRITEEEDDDEDPTSSNSPAG